MAVWGNAFVEGRDSNSIGQEMSTQYFNFHTLKLWSHAELYKQDCYLQVGCTYLS